MPLDLPFAARKPREPLALNIVTGALGAGKTTLLNRLLANPMLVDTAVLLNEDGEAKISAAGGAHFIDEGVQLLSGGCMCCTVRGELADALEALLRDVDNGRAEFRRVIVETSGMADPAPLLHTVMLHPYLHLRYRLDGIIAVVNAEGGAAAIATHPELAKQAALADRIVLTHAKAGEEATRLDHVAAARGRLQALNPAAPILDLGVQAPNSASLFGAGLYDPARGEVDVARWLALDAYAQLPPAGPSGIEPVLLTSSRPLSPAALDTFLELLRAMHGPFVLRTKGIVQLSDHPDQPLVVHGVQHVFHPPFKLAGWPDIDRRSRFVLITRGADTRVIRKLFAAVTDTPVPDTPDLAALRDNPLVPFGGSVSGA